MAEPSGVLLGNAYGYIDIDSSGAIASINQTKAQFNNFITDTGAMLQGFGNSLAGWGAQLTMWTAPLTVLGGVGLKVASDFDSVLTEIQARTGLTAEAMQQIKDAALEAGARTTFSSQQAADAFLNLLTAGLSVEDALKTLNPVLDAAAAGNMDLARAADYTTSIMAAYNLSAEDSTKIVNALAQAAGASPASMDEMGAALLRASASATRFGLDVTETSAILAIFAKNGLRGEEAGTQLNSMLRNMTSSAIPTQKVWEELGISLYDAQGQARDLDAVFADLRVALDGMADEDRNRIIQQLAGSEGMLAFNALLAGQSIASMTEEMDAQASASDVAAKMMASFAGMVDSLKGSIETLWITVLTPFMNNVLRPLIGGSDGTGGLIGVVNAVQAWAAANEPLVQSIVTLVAAFLALGPTAWGLGEAIKFVGFNLSTIGTIFGFIMSPLGLFIGGVALLAFIFRDQLWPALQFGLQGLSSFQDIFSETGDLVYSVVASVASFVSNFAISLGLPLEKAYALRDGIMNSFLTIRNFISGFVNTARNTLNIFFGLLQNGVPIFTALQTAFGATFGTWNWAKIGADILAGLSAGVSTVGSWVYDNLISPLMSAFSLIDWGMVGTAILQGIGLAISLYSSWINFVTDNILTPLFDNAKTALSTINWRQLGEDIIGFIFDPSSSEAGGVDWGAVFGGWMDAIVNFGTAVFDFVGWVFENVISPLWQGMMDGLSQVDWGEVWTTFLDLSGQALNALWTGATWVWDNLISPMINLVGGALAQVDWAAVGTTLLNLFGAGLTALWAGATWVWDNLISPMITAVGGALAQVDWMQLGTDILNALGAGLMALWGAATWAYDNLIQPLFDNAKLAIESIDWFSVGESIVNSIGTALKATFDFVAWIIDSIFNPVTAKSKDATGQVDWSSVGDSIMTAIASALVAFLDFALWVKETIIDPMIDGAATAIGNTDWSSIGQGLMDSISAALPNIQQWVQDWIIGPITRALSGFNPLAGLGGEAAPTLTTPSYNNSSIGGSGSFGSGGLGKMGKFAGGINYVPNDMIALIHRGERIERANENPYNPNAQAGMGKQFTFGDIIIENITAGSQQEASAMGEAFGDAFMRKLRNSGVESI